MRKMSLGLLGLMGLWLAAAPVWAESIRIIYKSNQIETGNIINSSPTAIFVEDAQYAVREIPLTEIESIFTEDGAEPVYFSQLWRYRPRSSLIAKAFWFPSVGVEGEFVLDPSASLALRGTVSQPRTVPAYGGGFSLRYYPKRTAPRGWYFGPQADYVGEPEWSMLTLKFEAGKKFYLENGLVFGFFFAAGLPIPLNGFGGVGAFVLPLYIVGGGGSIGYSF